ncbi:MAG TPA: allophanate hydrolase [Burkholderiales bacterium]|nr:allophanate hydrolase [Burkholderiales bacterium]
MSNKVHEAYARIAAHADNPIFIHAVPKEEALERAAAARGPLAGRLFAVKDNIDVAGLPTTAACPTFAYVANDTAPAVQKLLDAGAVLVGKTNLDQFATGLVGTRSPYGACRNAFDPSYISGGSSSGSAVAVALGIVDFALGTDTAGSGRVPAAFNNLVGLKPTRGLVSTQGVVPACRSLDCVSVFAKTCRDALEVFELMSRPFDPVAPRFGVAVPRQLEFHGDRDYERLFSEAVARLVALGGTVREIDFEPFLEVQLLLYGPWVAERLAEGFPLDQMLPVTRKVIESGARYSAADAFRAQHRLASLRKKCTFEDILVVPGAPTIYRIAEVEADPIELNSRLGRYTNFVNLLDLAAITVPAGFRADGLPFGITLIGPAFSDYALAAAAARFHGENEIPGPASGVQLAVVGAHLAGMPRNHELTERGARLVRTTRTAWAYRLFALDGKPGLVRAEHGTSIEVEVWDMPARRFGDFVAGIPAPLGIGTLELEDGTRVKGFLCEHHAVQGRPDISSWGGWRAYCANLRTSAVSAPCGEASSSKMVK